MKEPSDKPNDSSKSLFGWLFIIVAVMVASIFYPYPGGEMDFKTFVSFWLREIIVLGFFLVVFVWVGLSKFKKRSVGKSNEEHKAP